MALQLAFTAPIGVSFATAYARVTSGSWSAASGQITANIEVFATKDARVAGASPISAQGLSFPIDLTATQNVVAQAYAAIKARPEFAGAVDA